MHGLHEAALNTALQRAGQADYRTSRAMPRPPRGELLPGVRADEKRLSSHPPEPEGNECGTLPREACCSALAASFRASGTWRAANRLGRISQGRCLTGSWRAEPKNVRSRKSGLKELPGSAIRAPASPVGVFDQWSRISHWGGAVPGVFLCAAAWGRVTGPGTAAYGRKFFRSHPEQDRKRAVGGTAHS